MVKETVGMESLGENLKPTSQQEGTELEFAVVQQGCKHLSFPMNRGPDSWDV